MGSILGPGMDPEWGQKGCQMAHLRNEPVSESGVLDNPEPGSGKGPNIISVDLEIRGFGSRVRNGVRLPLGGMPRGYAAGDPLLGMDMEGC